MLFTSVSLVFRLYDLLYYIEMYNRYNEIYCHVNIMYKKFKICLKLCKILQ